jgi:UDP-N-acetylmuramoyl-tripeptide--D-alanyl-D-alanine ligase
MSHRGEIRRLAEICEPNLGLVTNVAPVHLEFFSSIEEIALAKRELVEGLAGDDPVAVLNADDSRVKSFARFCRGRVVFYGLDRRADFRANGLRNRGAVGMAFEVVNRAGRREFQMPLLGEHNVRNALAAFAAASQYGITAEAAAESLAASRPVHMRGELLHFSAGFSVLDDCYNSNPVALEAMIDLVAHFTQYRRRALVAGEMKELGPASGALHRRCGERAATAGLEWIFGVTGDAAALVEGAIVAGLSPDRTQFFPTVEEAAQFLPEWVQPGDLVLLKGSRAVHLERVVEAMKRRHSLLHPNSRRESGNSGENAASPRQQRGREES